MAIEMTDATFVEVEIDLFKPMGFADTYFVRTDDRGKAIRTVMARYKDSELKYVNAITAHLTGEPVNRRGAVIDAN